MIDQIKACVAGDGDPGEYEFVILLTHNVFYALTTVQSGKTTGTVEFISPEEMERVGKALIHIAKTMKNQ